MAGGYGAPQETDAPASTGQTQITAANQQPQVTQTQNTDAQGKQGGAGGKGGGGASNPGQNVWGSQGKGGGQSQGGSWWGGSAPAWTGTPGNIWGDQTAGVAGSNPMLDFGNQQIWNMMDNNRYTMNAENAINQSIMAGLPQMMGAEGAYSRLSSMSGGNPYEQAAGVQFGRMPGLAQRRVSGETVANDPAVAAANETFQAAMLPMIQNQAALAGLGRSTALTNAAAAQQAQTMLPLVQEAIAREERGLQGEVAAAQGAGQGYGSLGGQTTQRMLGGAQGLANLANMQGQRQANAASMFAGLQGQQQGQLMDQIGAAMASGQYGRGMVQEGLDAAYNEFLRKAGMFENATQGPLGAIGGLIGTTAEGKKS